MLAAGPAWYGEEDMAVWLALFVPETFEPLINASESFNLVAVDQVGEGGHAPGAIAGFVSVQADIISKLYVHGEYQGHGVGSLLMRAVNEYALTRRLPSLRLSSSKSALSFYERHGFKQSILSDTCMIHGVLCHVMEKRVAPILAPDDATCGCAELSEAEAAADEGAPSRCPYDPLQRRTPLTLVCIDMDDALMVDEVLRLADAFRLERVFLSGDSAMPLLRREAKTPWMVEQDAAAVVQEHVQRGYSILCLGGEHGVEPHTARLSLPACLLVGGDADACSLASLELSTPGVDPETSMQLSAAVGICIHEICRQAHEKRL